jgi:hypothetical protein
MGNEHQITKDNTQPKQQEQQPFLSYIFFFDYNIQNNEFIFFLPTIGCFSFFFV